MFLAVGLLAVLAAPPFVQDAAPSALPDQPLFESDELVEFRVVADFKQLLKDIGDNREEHEASLSYLNAAGDSVNIRITLETRGLYRRNKKICNFPPLMVDVRKKDFDADQTKGTLFENQNKLKLVAHCQDKKDDYEQSVLQEYLIYKTLNLLTENSFRARLGRLTYIDSSGKRDSIIKYGFFIEDADLVAERMGSEIFRQEGIHPLDADYSSTVLLAVFQYMILNTDWSVSGLHNIKLVGPLNATVYPIAWDFDWAGIIGAPYAKPDKSLGIRSVRDRLFIGYCRSESEFAQAFAVFNRNQEAIYQLHRDQVGLDERKLKRMLKDYDKFCETINQPSRLKQTIMRQCKKR